MPLWSLFWWCAVGLDSACFRWQVKYHGWVGVYSTCRLAYAIEHERLRARQVGVRTTWLVENSVEELRDGNLLMLFRTHDTGFIYSVCLHERRATLYVEMSQRVQGPFTGGACILFRAGDFIKQGPRLDGTDAHGRAESRQQDTGASLWIGFSTSATALSRVLQGLTSLMRVFRSCGSSRMVHW